MLEKRPLYPLRQTLEAARMERESARGPESGTPAFGASYINPHPLLTLAARNQLALPLRRGRWDSVRVTPSVPSP